MSFNVLMALVGALGMYLVFLGLYSYVTVSLQGPPGGLLYGPEERPQRQRLSGSLLERLDQMLYQARMPVKAGEFLGVSALLGAGVAALMLFATGALAAVAVGFVSGSFLYYIYLDQRRSRHARPVRGAAAPRPARHAGRLPLQGPVPRRGSALCRRRRPRDLPARFRGAGGDLLRVAGRLRPPAPSARPAGKLRARSRRRSAAPVPHHAAAHPRDPGSAHPAAAQGDPRPARDARRHLRAALAACDRRGRPLPGHSHAALCGAGVHPLLFDGCGAARLHRRLRDGRRPLSGGQCAGQSDGQSHPLPPSCAGTQALDGAAASRPRRTTGSSEDLGGPGRRDRERPDGQLPLRRCWPPPGCSSWSAGPPAASAFPWPAGPAR